MIALLPAVMLQAEEKKSVKKEAPKVEKTVKVGAQAPDFQIKDTNGKLIKLSDLTKKVRCWSG